MIKTTEESEKLRLLQKLSLYFYNRPRRTALICLVLVVFGALSYTTFLKREGFPAIETPFAISQGTYLVDNPKKVDGEVAKPLSEFLLEQEEVDSVLTQSFNNFFIAQVSYSEGVSAEEISPELQKSINELGILPKQATNKLEAFKFGYTPRGDNLVISFYSQKNIDDDILIAKANQAADLLDSQDLSLVESVSIINPYEKARNPVTGEEEIAQKSFDRYGERVDGKNEFHKSVVIGLKSVEGADAFELQNQVQSAVTELNNSSDYNGFTATISASDAPQISDQVNELQRVLLEALIAILIVGSIIIAIRASIITVVSMFTVLATVNGLLYLVGYSLNTITLFALILSLSLIVDDTIIMVEALDAQRKRRKKGAQAVSIATRKVSRAMVAATTTAALSFVPLIFVGGILGEFIRAIPYTIIAALFISLIVALIFIPLFSRFLLLDKKHLGNKVKEPAAEYEARIAAFIAKPILWARHSYKKLTFVGVTAVFVGFAFIGAGGWIFSKVTFNIFPSVKDANQLVVTTSYPPQTTIKEAESISGDVEKGVSEVVGEEFVQSGYYGEASTEKSVLKIDLTKYDDRDIKSPEIVKQLNSKFEDFNKAQVNIAQLDAGPPASAFTARVDSSENREGALRLSNDISNFLEEDAVLTRLDGSNAEIKNVSKPNPGIFNRTDNQPFVVVEATYVDGDTTTLVTLTQDAVEKEFPPDRVEAYGLKSDSISFDFGQESENQESFATLAIAFPIVMIAIYFLLTLEFRSFMQPVVIFMAIPFSLFGVTLGLYLTNNAFSFFSMMAFFALIGLSIKNTILLTDFANQSRKAGMNPVDSIVAALAERFRPLIATSLTAIVSLIPLALQSPFWEGLAVTLMFGLASSTMLVILVFPYYFLGAEFLRIRTGRGFRKLFKRA